MASKAHAPLLRPELNCVGLQCLYILCVANSEGVEAVNARARLVKPVIHHL